MNVTVGTARVGNRTLASSRDASFVFDIVGTGPLSQRQVVPSSPRAIALAGTNAGAELTHAISRFASQIDTQSGASELHQMVIAPDVDAVAGMYFANEQAPALDTKVTPAKRDELEHDIAEQRSSVAAMNGVNGAFTDRGVTYTMPDTSRALLASVGAYRPAPGESYLPKSKSWHAFLPKLMRHEVEHTDTPPTAAEYNSNLGGLEEGIAETLAHSQPSLAAGRHDLPPLTAFGVPSSTAATATTDGWHAYQRPPKSTDTGKTSNARYLRRQHLVGDLLRLAGVDHNTREGYATARDLLQGTNLTRVPGNLARAIIAQHDVDPAKYEPIRRYIHDITEMDSNDPIAGLRALIGL